MVYIDTIYDDVSVNSCVTVDGRKTQEPVEEEVTRRPACPCLRFNLEQNVVNIIGNNEDFSNEERDAAFYSTEELRQMKTQVRHVARWLADNNLDSTGEPDFTMRGMESMVYHEAHLAKKSSRRLAASAVFMEQEMQEGEGQKDVEAIAEEYYQITAVCQRRAEQAGANDALEVYQ